MKKSKLSQLAAIVFLFAFIVSMRWFDDEGAGFFIVVSIGAFIISLWYLDNNL